uniref:PKS-NRPS hybrid synthetase cheA-like n=1 Tax=Erigeron canadensis TaxID=72917 RepID=UPI001CB92837|nr:PKS-NRPS hybrid synthetase cheA-like [Erigeron canadensis]
MDNSDDNNSDEGGNFDYDATPFYTDESFNSVEELTEWAQATAMSLGYVLVKGRSNTNAADDVSRVLLICDRGGTYRKRSKGIRKSFSKKCNCPFKLQGYYSEYGWRVNVIDHTHNHDIDDVYGHAFARRFSPAEEEWVRRQYYLNLNVQGIFDGLRKEFPNNLSLIKDVHNLLEKIRNE